MMNFYILSLLTTLLLKEVYGDINNIQQTNWHLCKGLSGGSFPHPLDCTKFIECDREGSIIKSCGPGNAYNPKIHLCDWPYNVPGCFGASEGENYLQGNSLLPQSTSQNGDNQQLESSYTQNYQTTDNNQQYTENAQNYPSIQNGPQSITVKPNFFPTRNVDQPKNQLIYIPPIQNQSKWNDLNKYLSFGNEHQPVTNNQAYFSGQSVNQPNGHEAFGIQQNKYYPGNSDYNLNNNQPNQNQPQWSDKPNSPFILIQLKKNDSEVYEPVFGGSENWNINQNDQLTSHKQQNGHGYWQNLIDQDDKRNYKPNQNKRQIDSNNNQADKTWNNDDYSGLIDIRVKNENKKF